MEKLGGPTFIPNPLPSPALMVLASTAEAARSSSSSPGPMNDYHAIYSSPPSRYLDGETVHRMVLNSTHYQHRSSHLALYPGAEHYTERVSQEFSPHFLQLHHHLGGGLLHKTTGPTAVFNGTGAFRRVAPPDHPFPFHRIQHQRNLLDREHSIDSLYKSPEHVKEPILERGPKERSPPRKLEKELEAYQKVDHSGGTSPRRRSSREGSESGKLEPVAVKKELEEGSECCESSGAEDPEVGTDLPFRRRRKASSTHPPCCPVCGTSIRPGEMESHFAWEMERFHEENRKLRRSQRDVASHGRKNGESLKRVKQESKGGATLCHDDTPGSTRQQTYLRVCANRMSRSGRATALKPTRSRSSQSSPVNSPVDGDEGPSGVDTTLCPVCEERIHGSGDELNAHVEACLRKKGSITDEMDETNVQETFEEYEWAGQTRIRATSLLEGGFRASGFQTGVKRKKEDEDDEDLNIDGDDSEEYGRPHVKAMLRYSKSLGVKELEVRTTRCNEGFDCSIDDAIITRYTEADVIPCGAEEPDEDSTRQVLRGAILRGSNSPVEKNSPPRDQILEDDCEVEAERTIEQKDDTGDGIGDPDLVISTLKARIKELERKKSEKIKCLICMEPYTVPLASISCWHVHCEECWLRTLGAKKLCPQCNMITSPSDLRRIYL